MTSNSDNKELKLFVNRIERVDSEMQNLRDDKKDIFAEAKANGYDARTIREVVRLRKLTPAVRQERKVLLDTYLAAFGIDD